MNILITGGAGYIGNYIIELLVENNNVVVVDNLSTGHIDGVHKDAKLMVGDIRDEKFLDDVFSKNSFDVVIHMAALISVEESTREPLKYYDVNVAGTICLLKVMEKYGVNKIVFSSTAAVYADISEGLVYEDSKIKPSNTYGLTKYQGEQIIIDEAKSRDFKYTIFRYFNVAGGRKPGYNLNYMSSLIPKVICSVRDDEELFVFGDDYDTKDGTCVRDFIFIKDLAYAHVLGMNSLFEEEDKSGIYNLGTGNGYSVLEIIKAAGEALDKEISYTVSARRPGDTVFSVASAKRAKEILGWENKVNDVKKIIFDMWDNNK